jgi:hypothetical protein
VDFSLFVSVVLSALDLLSLAGGPDAAKNEVRRHQHLEATGRGNSGGMAFQSIITSSPWPA